MNTLFLKWFFGLHNLTHTIGPLTILVLCSAGIMTNQASAMLIDPNTHAVTSAGFMTVGGILLKEMASRLSKSLISGNPFSVFQDETTGKVTFRSFLTKLQGLAFVSAASTGLIAPNVTDPASAVLTAKSMMGFGIVYAVASFVKQQYLVYQSAMQEANAKGLAK